jgi:hypothetical protein
MTYYELIMNKKREIRRLEDSLSDKPKMAYKNLKMEEHIRRLFENTLAIKKLELYVFEERAKCYGEYCEIGNE